MRLADYVMKYLKDKGVDHIFVVTGGGSIFLDDALGKSGIDYTCCHHEQAAGFAAESYARRKESLGVALVTSGPGGTNIVTAAVSAWLDSVPVLILSGQVFKNQTIGDSGLRQVGIQEINIIDLIKPITKYAVMVRNPKKIKYHLQKAISLATTGRPGPVWLDIPADVQMVDIDENNLLEFKSSPDPSHKWDAFYLRQAVKDLTLLLEKSKKPLIHIGQGVRLAGATGSLRKLLFAHGIPVVTSRNANDILPSDNKNLIGRPGIFGDRPANFAVQNCDLYLAIGTSLAMAQTGYDTDDYVRRADVKIMVDIEESIKSKPYLHFDMVIRSDADIFLKELHRQMSGLAIGIQDWRLQCVKWKQRYPVVLPEYKYIEGCVNSYYFIDVLSDILTPTDTIVTDMGFAFQCTHQTFKVKEGQRFYTSSGLSAMGWGLPAAIGACIANNRQRTICIAGDGGLQMNIQELATIARHNLPIKLFVFNNSGYSTIKQTFEAGAGDVMGCNTETGLLFPNLDQLAKAYGMSYVRIESHVNILEVLQSTIDFDGPVICELMLDPDQRQMPKVMTGHSIDDMYPYLSKEELKCVQAC